MLEHTFHRAEKLIKTERLFTVVNRYHLNHRDVRQQLLSRAPGTVVLQPANKETGPGILLPLMHVYKNYPGATVAVFPSDHFIVEEDLFMDHVELALSAVERNPSSLVLLGIQPHEPSQHTATLCRAERRIQASMRCYGSLISRRLMPHSS